MAETATATVYVATITHRHGVNVYVAQTEDRLQAEVLAYVTEWWGEVADKVGPMSSDSASDIATYFEMVGDETLEECGATEVLS